MQRAVEFRDSDFVADVERPVEDACNRQPSEVIAVVEIRDQDLQCSRRIAGRLRNVPDDGLEQGT